MSIGTADKLKDRDVQAPSQDLSRYFDAQLKRWVIKVLPGTQYVTSAHDEIMATTLGSCVSACIWDEVTGLSGMNHFMLPGDGDCDWSGADYSLRFGHFAMESLLNIFLSQGSCKKDLVVKLFGGANVADFKSLIGDQNGKFAIDYLSREGITLQSSDLGGDRARRVLFNPQNGRVKRRLIAKTNSSQLGVIAREKFYQESLAKKKPDEDSIVLFD